MTDQTPPLGLLLDVDGPIASPVTRSIAIPAIARDLAELANRGIPIAFNTGRSDAFLRAQVIPPLLAAGLSDDVRVWGICEKGAVHMRITAQDLKKLGIIDDIIAEPLGGAHRGREQVFQAADDAIARSLRAFAAMPADALRMQRRDKFLAIGRDL